MIKEHYNIIADISSILTNILVGYEPELKFTVKYMDDIFHAIEICIINGALIKSDDKKLKEKIEKFNDIVTDIYTIEEQKLYLLYLKPIDDIRNIKINKLQNKISNGTENGRFCV